MRRPRKRFGLETNRTLKWNPWDAASIQEGVKWIGRHHSVRTVWHSPAQSWKKRKYLSITGDDFSVIGKRHRKPGMCQKHVLSLGRWHRWYCPGVGKLKLKWMAALSRRIPDASTGV